MKGAPALGRSASVEDRGLGERGRSHWCFQGWRIDLHWEERLKMIDFHYLSFTFELARMELS